MNYEPECDVDIHGTIVWRLNGKLHRLDGPAYEWISGARAWYINNVGIARTAEPLHVGQAIPWEPELIAVVIKQINHTLFQVLIGNKKEYLFSTYKDNQDE